MSPRSVLQLIPSFGSGGAERQLSYLCEGLQRKGWQVSVGILRGGPNLERVERSGARVEVLRAASHYDPRLLGSLDALIRDSDPMVVQTWIPMMDVAGGLAALRRRRPWILSERSDPRQFPTSTKFRVRARLARRAEAVVSNSPGGDAYWEGVLGARPIRRRVIPNALPLDEIDAAPAAPLPRPGLQEGPLLVSFGRFEALKNVDVLVDALERLFARQPGVALLCGEGPRLAALRERVAAGGLADRIALPGFADDVSSLLKAAAGFVSLSRYEGMPNAAMEAMAARCPLVLSRIPAHTHLVPEDAAVWVTGDDPVEVAEALARLLADPSGAAARAQRARAEAEDRSVEQVSAVWEALYEEVAL